MLLKCFTQYASKFGKPSSGHRTGKCQFSFQSPKKGNAKDCSNYHIIVLILHASKIMLKILQARLQPYVNWELPDVQAGFRKGRGTWVQIANIHWVTANPIFLGSKITAYGDCSHEIKKRLLLRRKVMTNLDSILKSRDITLSTNVHLDKAMVF